MICKGKSIDVTTLKLILELEESANFQVIIFKDSLNL